ncbi:MAG TPA: class I SAM-dependent methyltransferase [Baekduia sp.]|jgi:SAM-dependent methyltransferase
MLHEDRRRAGSFGADADRYDRVRPSYPDALIDHLLAEPAPAVLDVGCGTGIASALFAARGCEVLGVEPDARMAEVARRRGLTVEVGGFEDWDAAGRRFDLLVCGQAWHWIDPARGSAKAAECVRPDGRVGIFWNFGTPEPAALKALDAVYDRVEPELGAATVLLGHGRDDRLEIAASGLRETGKFTEPEQHRWTWTRRYTTAEWQEHLLSHSDHQTLDPARRAPLLAAVAEATDALGGGFDLVYTTAAVTARRLA